jgi:hypothetical protein
MRVLDVYVTCAPLTGAIMQLMQFGVGHGPKYCGRVSDMCTISFFFNEVLLFSVICARNASDFEISEAMCDVLLVGGVTIL